MDNSIFVKISNRFGTPSYVYFEDIIKNQIQKIFTVFSGIDYFPTFAVKANSNPILLAIIKNHGFGMEITSTGEFYGAIKAGVKPENIIWNGSCKTVNDMNFFLKQRIGRINIDSFSELEDWGKVLNSTKSSEIPKFYVRINPDINSQTHSFIQTGLLIHKFGIPLESVHEFLKLSSENNIKIAGFHIHIGSQITKIEPFLDAIEKTSKFLDKYELTEIDIGGGWGIEYNDSESLNLVSYRENIIPLIKNYKVCTEFGRFVIGEAGVYLTRVERVKRTQSKTFVIVDGGMNHFIRPALYGAKHPYEIIGERKEGSVNFDIVGPICESGDVLYSNTASSLPKEGSLIVFKFLGAYGFSMASRYNGYPLPPEILICSNGSVKLIRRRESFKDTYRGVINQ